MVRGMALTARMVATDCADPAGPAKFHIAAVEHEIAAADYEARGRHEERFGILGPAGGEGVSIGLRRVPEPTAEFCVLAHE